MCVAKTKALINCAVTAQLIWVFVFAYANCWFSCAAAHITATAVGRYMRANIQHVSLRFILFI